MNQEPNPDSTNQIKNAFEPLEKSATTACDFICTETRHLTDKANDCIRKNPLPSVVGAAVFGAAVCYLIMTGRHEATFRERYIDGPLADAGDSLGSSLRSAYDNLKFW